MATAQYQNKTDQSQKNTSPRQPQAQTRLETTPSPPELQAALGNPRATRPETILRLQRMAGNRATHRLIQAKLMVDPAGDRYEQEADRLTQQVMATTVRPESPPANEASRFNARRMLTHTIQPNGMIQCAPSWTAATRVKELPENLYTDKDRKKLEDDRNVIKKLFGSNPVNDKLKGLSVKVLPKYGKQLQAFDFGTTPESMSEYIGSRFPKGPLLTDKQGKFLKYMSLSSQAGRDWLSFAGLFPYETAVDFLQAHKYQAWLKLDAANRVWLAYIAWREFGEEDFVKGTPPYNLGRSMDGKDQSIDQTKRDQYKETIDEDIRDAWVKTLASPPEQLNDDARSAIEQGGAINQKGKSMDEVKVRRNVASATEVLKRLLIILHAGLRVYSREGEKFEDYTGSVVRALSHGGRVNIRIPALSSKKEDADKLMKWLGLFNDEGKRQEQIGLFERSFGTHHLAIGKNKEGQPGKIREQGGAGAALKSKLGSTQMFGMNLAVGGLGNKDFNGDVILPDGAHGHLLIFYRPPTLERDGGLMVGIETTGPHAPSTVGYAHTAKSSEATANPESSFGGLKADKVGEGSPATLKWWGRYKDDDERKRSHEESLARFVDLSQVNGGQWLDYLTGLKCEFDELGHDKGEVAQLEKLVGKRQSLDELHEYNQDDH